MTNTNSNFEKTKSFLDINMYVSFIKLTKNINLFLIINIFLTILLIAALLNIYNDYKNKKTHKKDIKKQSISNNGGQPYYIESIPVSIPVGGSIATKGVPSEFVQIGLLTSDDKTKILKLYGRQIYTNSDSWNYYTVTDSFNFVQIPLIIKNKDCSDITIGCKEIYSGDKVFIEEYNKEFTVTIYNKATYMYNPKI